MASRTLKGLISLSVIALSALAPKTFAAPTDIVAGNSTLRDSLARLAADGVLSANASSLLQDRILTRSDAAHLLESGLGLSGSLVPHLTKTGDAAAIRSALTALRSELISDHVDVDAVLKSLPSNSSSYLGFLQPEARIDTGGSNNPGSGTIGIYRGTVVSDLGSHTQYGLSVSDQAQDDRRVFDNDTGAHDFSAVSQAYIQYNGSHGLNLLLGRTDNNWGPGAEGGALLSDNAPPLDQLRVAFPFSLGHKLGRNWDYTQLAATYDQDDTRTYFQARRVEINFNQRWSAQYEEALKSTSSSLLLRAPLPFLIAKSIDLQGVEGESEFIGNLGLQFQATPAFRTYGQLLINDIKSPFRGHFLGFDTGDGGTTPQRLAYLLGAGYESHSGTSVTVEYSAADPTTYLDAQPKLEWTKGAYDYLGLPDGPNFNQLYGLISQQISPKVTLYLQGRDRMRYSNNYPAPAAQDIAASAKYQFDRKNSVSLTYHDYSQHAYPIAAGAPGYPAGDGDIAPSESNPGFNTEIHELDAGYQLVF